MCIGLHEGWSSVLMVRVHLWVSTSGGGGYYCLLGKGQLVCPTKHQRSKKAGGEIRDSAVKPSGEQATEIKGRLAKGRVQFEAP